MVIPESMAVSEVLVKTTVGTDAMEMVIGLYNVVDVR
jgi:hypothetical protein